MDTPQREGSVASASPCADGTPSDIDALKREYESYRLKTKDWQAKVRDRDVKMRLQLQETTDMLVSKDAELDVMSKRIAELESQRHEWNTIKTAHGAAAEDASRLREEVADCKTQMLTLRASLREAEVEVSQRNEDVKALRLRVGDLEAALADMQWRAAGGHILQTSMADSTSRPVEVRHRIAVGDEIYCYVSPTDGKGGAWLQESRVPATVVQPPLMQDIASQQCSDAVAEAVDALRAALLEETSAQLLSAQKLSDEALSAAVKAERDAAQISLDTIHDKLAATQAELQERSHTFEKFRSVDVPAALAAAREEVAASMHATIRQLQSKVDDLESYKSRAQVAMRHAAQTATATVDATKLRDQLEIEYAAKRAHETEEFERRLAAALRLRESEVLASAEADAQREAARLFSIIQSREATIEELEHTIHEMRQQSVSILPAAAHAESQPRSDDLVETVDGSSQTEEPVLQVPPPHHRPLAAPVDHSSDSIADPPVPPPRRSSSSEAAPSTLFAFESVLNALDTHAAQAPATSWEVDRMRQQLQTQSLQLQRHREELREVALREKTLLEQGAVLKEQFREMERSLSRSQELREREDYLKNIVVKVLTCNNGTMRKMLMPVVAEVLHLSPAERTSLLESCEP
jgi:hypothetical protein